MTRNREDFCCVKGRMPFQVWHLPAMEKEKFLFDVFKRGQCRKCKKVRFFVWHIYFNSVETPSVRLRDEAEILAWQAHVENKGVPAPNTENMRQLKAEYTSTASEYTRMAAKDTADVYRHVQRIG